MDNLTGGRGCGVGPGGAVALGLALAAALVCLVGCNDSPSQPTPTKTCGYTAWTPSVCPASAKQTRSVDTNNPAGCTQPANPILEQPCSFTGPITVTVKAYLSPGGYRGELTKTGTGGQSMTVCLGELGLAGIDAQRIALRKDVVDGHVGDYLASSKTTGCASFTPTGNMTIAAYGFVSDIYDVMDSNIRGNTQTVRKQATVYLDPSYPATDAEVRALDNAIANYNGAFGQAGALVGSLTRIAGSTGDIRIVFYPPGSPAVGGANSTSPPSIYINTSACDAHVPWRNIQGVLNEEFFYLLTHVGGYPTYPFGLRHPDDMTLTQRGANLTNYTYLMSPKNWQ